MYALNAYLNFQGHTREALTFYHSVFGGELSFATFGQFGAVPEGHPAADLIMHGSIEGPVNLYGADHIEGMAPHAFAAGNNVNLAFMGDAASYEQLAGWFDRLAEGGQVIMPLGAQVWGDIYGGVVDKYGISWMFNIGQAAR